VAVSEIGPRPLAGGRAFGPGRPVRVFAWIVAGSHDPLLEWALRESGSGLALLAEGSEAGLRRLAAGEAMVAGIHLHRIEGEDADANLQAVASESALADAVLIAWARREQGLVLAPGNPLKVKTSPTGRGARGAAGRRARGAVGGFLRGQVRTYRLKRARPCPHR
jgi:hypothetical protein